MLLCTGFLSYSGPFNQEFRDMLMGKWQKDMKSRKIPFTANLNVTGMLVDAATVRNIFFPSNLVDIIVSYKALQM